MSGTKLRKLLQEKMEQANSRRKVTAEDTKRLAKLEVIVDKLSVEKTCKIFSCKRGLTKMSTLNLMLSGINNWVVSYAFKYELKYS